MGVDIRIRNFKVFNQLKNGSDFTQDTAEYTVNLAACIGEKVKATFDQYVSWFFKSSTQNKLTISNTKTTYVRDSGNWINDGFSIGDNIQITQPSTSKSNWGTITEVTDLEIILTSVGGTLTDGPYSDVIVYGSNILESVIFSPNLIENDEVFTTTSKVSKNETGYYISEITGSPQQFKILNQKYEDWITSKDQNSINYSGSTFINSIKYQIFHYEIEFIVTPFYLEEWYNLFLDNDVPELYKGLNSIKFVGRSEYRNVLSNSDSAKIFINEGATGSVGFYNNNFNGFNNEYTLETIEYKDTTTLTSVDSVQTASKTTIYLKFNGSFNTSDRIGAMIHYKARQDEYENKDTTIEENFMLDNIVAATDGAETIGTGVFKRMKVYLSGGDLYIELDTEYSTEQQIRLINDPEYILGILLADNSKSAGSSNRVMYLAANSLYSTTSDIAGLFQVSEFEILTHPQLDIDSNYGSTDIEAWNEDGLVCRYSFWIDLSKDALLNSMDFGIYAYDSTTENYFVLDNYSFILNDIISSGIQQININQTRGYLLNTNDDFNILKFTTGSKIGDKQYYTVTIGQKIKWQDWQENLNVDTVFYDNTKPQNNLNNMSSNYSSINNYEIKFGILANVYGTDGIKTGNTDYLALSPDLTIKDYDIPVTYTNTIKTYNPDTLVDLNQGIRKDGDTLFEITWEKLTPFTDLSNAWGIHRIEEVNGEGDIMELSSKAEAYEKDILKPISGESYLKLTAVTTSKIVTECLIDYTKLKKGIDYKLSGRIDDGTGVQVVKLMEDGTIKEMEDGTTKITDQ